MVSDKCQKEKRKTINGDDLLCAMATFGFEDYIASLKVYLTRYREGSASGGDRSSKRDIVGAQIDPNALFCSSTVLHTRHELFEFRSVNSKEEFKDEEMVDVKSLHIQNFL
ncbi:unnamed protein product [Camellia sinensis]